MCRKLRGKLADILTITSAVVALGFACYFASKNEEFDESPEDEY